MCGNFRIFLLLRFYVKSFHLLGNDPQPYYVVGTGLVSPEESEARAGRIIIFQW